jgi:hypothetical protein
MGSMKGFDVHDDVCVLSTLTSVCPNLETVITITGSWKKLDGCWEKLNPPFNSSDLLHTSDVDTDLDDIVYDV